jgi:hypothetical protein
VNLIVGDVTRKYKGSFTQTLNTACKVIKWFTSHSRALDILCHHQQECLDAKYAAAAAAATSSGSSMLPHCEQVVNLIYAVIMQCYLACAHLLQLHNDFEVIALMHAHKLEIVPKGTPRS